MSTGRGESWTLRRSLGLFALAAVALAAVARAQFSPQLVITTAANGAYSVYASDLDGDGRPDVLSASFSDGKIAWCRNLGGGTFSSQLVITTAADSARSVYASDLDGDGRPDVLSALAHDGKIAWYRNLGSGTFSSQLVITTAASGATSVYASDLDGDGRPDVLSASLGGDKIAWYRNLGGGTFSSQLVITTAADYASSVYASDLDGDGRPDVLSASRDDNKIAWYRNLGSGTFSSQLVITTAANGATSVYASDLDGDGRPDVLSASANDDKIAWYRNLGGGTFSSQLVITTAANGAWSVYASDLDGDGRPDVLSASQGYNGIAWYRNLGGGTFSSQLVITTATNLAYSVYASDLDGDGRPDVLSASYSDNKIAWYQNQPCAASIAALIPNAVANWAGASPFAGTAVCRDGFVPAAGSAASMSVGTCAVLNAYTPPGGSVTLSCVPSGPACPLLPPVYGGTLSLYTGDWTSATSVVSCNTGFVLSADSSLWRECLPSGAWSGVAPVCVPNSCLPLVAPPNSVLSPATGEGIVGGSVLVLCSLGYTTASGPVASVTCLANGTWAATPVCSRASCPLAVAPANGFFEGEFTGLVGNSLAFACDAGYSKVGSDAIVCQADGTWTNASATCVANSCSPPLAVPRNGHVTGANGAAAVDGVTGDTRSFWCDPGYALVGGGVTRTCQPSGAWSDAQPSCCGANTRLVGAVPLNVTDGSGAVLFALASTDCTCLSGFFAASRADAGAMGDCEPCPPNARCAGGTAAAEAQDDFAPTADPRVFAPCSTVTHACRAGGVCAAGYGGALCSGCEPRHFRTSAGLCARCVSEPWQVALGLVLAAGFSFACMLLFVWEPMYPSRSKDERVYSDLFKTGHCVPLRHAARLLRLYARSAAVIAIQLAMLAILAAFSLTDLTSLVMVALFFVLGAGFSVVRERAQTAALRAQGEDEVEAVLARDSAFQAPPLLGALLRSLIVFAQSFAAVLGYTSGGWSVAVAAMGAASSQLSVQLTGIDCLGPGMTLFVRNTIIVAIVPGSCAVIALAYLVRRLTLSREVRAHVASMTARGESERFIGLTRSRGAWLLRDLRARCERAAVFVLNFFAFPLAAQSLALLSCRTISDREGRVMAAAPWIACDSSTRRSLVALAVATLAALAVSMGAVIWALRRAVASGPRAVAASPAGFLMDGLRPAYWWFDVGVVLGRRLGLALMFSVVAQSSRAIASMGALAVLAGALALQWRVAPYAHGELNTVEGVSVVVTAGALQLGLIAESESTSSASVTVFSVGVVLAVGWAVGLYFWQLAKPLIAQWQRVRVLRRESEAARVRSGTMDELGADSVPMLAVGAGDEYWLYGDTAAGAAAAGARAGGGAEPVGGARDDTGDEVARTLAELRAEVAAARAELRAEVAVTMRAEVTAVRAELNTAVATMRADAAAPSQVDASIAP